MDWFLYSVFLLYLRTPSATFTYSHPFLRAHFSMRICFLTLTQNTLGFIYQGYLACRLEQHHQPTLADDLLYLLNYYLCSKCDVDEHLSLKTCTGFSAGRVNRWKKNPPFKFHYYHLATGPLGQTS